MECTVLQRQWRCSGIYPFLFGWEKAKFDGFRSVKGKPLRNES